jgi:hypothetical protein
VEEEKEMAMDASAVRYRVSLFALVSTSIGMSSEDVKLRRDFLLPFVPAEGMWISADREFMQQIISVDWHVEKEVFECGVKTTYDIWDAVRFNWRADGKRGTPSVSGAEVKELVNDFVRRALVDGWEVEDKGSVCALDLSEGQIWVPIW